MDGLQFEIAKFLVARAAQRQRATYQQVGEAVGWSHPTGRGLGRNLEVILHYLHDQGLPPLTTILVRKGQRYPHDDAMAFIHGALGKVDIELAQKQFFDFDWSKIPALMSAQTSSTEVPAVWLTSFWGFDPADWGCIGFADEAKRKRYVRKTKPGDLVAIYVTKGRGPENMRGRVVGILEISHEVGHAKQFISGTRWAEKEKSPDTKGKWLYALKATRAWRIVPEDWLPVEELLPEAYASAHPEFIGASGVPIGKLEAEKLLELDAYEVPVYGQGTDTRGEILQLKNALKPSRAINPASEPYWISEADGPKYLYVLELQGNIANYLGRSPTMMEGKSIIKVGFSKSPSARCAQIQSAYPAGQYYWKVRFPVEVAAAVIYPDASVAIAGEDAMKERLVRENAEVLGGEFFLADEWLVHSAWSAGRRAADLALQRRSTSA